MRIVAGQWGGRRIQAPAGRDVRPTTDRVREAWMSMLHPRLPGARVADLFAGSGALGLECLSRGASEVVFVENAPASVACIRSNLAALGAGQEATVVPGDALAWVEALGPHAYDLVLADPPYDGGFLPRLLEAFRHVPFARELWVEHRSSQTPPPAPGLRSRRYGDTTLTCLEASA